MSAELRRPIDVRYETEVSSVRPGGCCIAVPVSHRSVLSAPPDLRVKRARPMAAARTESLWAHVWASRRDMEYALPRRAVAAARSTHQT